MLFYVGVYKDQRLAESCLTSLQRLYPTASFLSISDGVDDLVYEKFCAARGITYQVGQRLKLSKYGGQWTARFLDAFLQAGHSHVIKVDPDTRPNHTVVIPDSPIFSAIRLTWKGERIFNGPAIGFTRAAAQRIVDSGMLLEPQYTGRPYYYTRFCPPLLRAGEEQSNDFVSLQDEITTHIAGRLGIEHFEWSDVSLTNEAAAFYHPK